jgi:hypothetical protein
MARRKEEKVNKKETPVLIPSARQRTWFVESPRSENAIKYWTVL